MRLQLILHKRRGVSPIIATVLMIALVLAAGTVVVVLLNNVETRGDLIDTSEATIGTESAVIENQPLLSITKLSVDVGLQLQGIPDYVQITLFVDNIDDDDIYIMDIDIMVFGVKLDELSPWRIIDATGATLAPQANGQYAGYRQAANTNATYQVAVDDKTIANARIPDQTNFLYEVKYGVQPGVVSNTVIQEKIAEIIFSTVFYDVAIFHYGSPFNFDDAAAQYEESLSNINGTNELFYLYDRSTDAYDYQNAPGAINETQIANDYDLVLIDTWAVPASIDDKLVYIHENGTNMVFYGSVNDLGGNLAAITVNINNTATELITGAIPNHFDGNHPGSFFQRTTDNGYTFNTTNDAIIAGLSGANFEEDEGVWPFQFGDDQGFDAANITSNNREDFLVYGTAYYNYYDGGTPYWQHLGPLMVHKPAKVNGTGNVFTFIWKHNQDLSPVQLATVASAGQLTSIRLNMIGNSFSELDRISTTAGQMQIDSLVTTFVSGNNREFSMELLATVIDGQIEGESLLITIDAPDALNFIDLGPFTSYDIDVDLDNDGTVDLAAIPMELAADNKFEVDIGAYYNGTLTTGQTMKIILPNSGSISLWTANTATLTWTVVADYNIVRQTVQNFDIAID